MSHPRCAQAICSIPLLLLLVMSNLSACTTAPSVSGAQHPRDAQETPAANPTQIPTVETTAAAVPAPTQAASPKAPVSPPAGRILAFGDQVSVPILLYHHVSDETPGNRYTIETAKFRAHMQALHEAGWTAITTHVLADMLRGYAPLPEKALVITFDDGAQDIYQNAFPIMQETGFPGVFFLVSSAVGSEGYASADQLKEMIAAGWEIGSHSMTHADLTKTGVDLRLEMYQSAVQLETALDIPVRSFAYPFSAGSENLYRLAPQFGYTNASCAGWNNLQSAQNVYCLSRREIKAGTTAADLLKLVAEP